MKVGIMADSHDNLPLIGRAVAAFEARGCEALLHCGDFVAPFAVKAVMAFNGQVMGVFGNNDGERPGIRGVCENVFDPPHTFVLARRKIMAVHDEASIPESPDADVVVYGHSHAKACLPGQPLKLNPGEAGGWLTGAPTAAVLDTDTLDVEWIDL